MIKAGKTFEVIAKNSLDDVSMATPAISEGVIYFRTGKGLIAVGNKQWHREPGRAWRGRRA